MKPHKREVKITDSLNRVMSNEYRTAEQRISNVEENTYFIILHSLFDIRYWTPYNKYQKQLSAYGLCRPYGAKTIGVSFYPPLTQWATVVAPRRGAFVMPRSGQHNRSPLRKRWENYCTALSSPGGATQTQTHSNILLYHTENSGQTELVHATLLTSPPVPPQ